MIHILHGHLVKVSMSALVANQSRSVRCMVRIQTPVTAEVHLRDRRPMRPHQRCAEHRRRLESTGLDAMKRCCCRNRPARCAFAFQLAQCCFALPPMAIAVSSPISYASGARCTSQFFTESAPVHGFEALDETSSQPSSRIGHGECWATAHPTPVVNISK